MNFYHFFQNKRYLFGKLSLKLEDAKLYGAHSLLHEENHHYQRAEVESKYWSYNNTIDDYNEMAIQFGYITL